MLLALLLVAGLGPGASLLGGGSGPMEVDGQEVLVVDGPCDQSGVPIDQQRLCRHPQHLNVLRITDGNYWNVSLESEVGRQLLLDPSWRGRRMTVDGKLYPDIRTLQLERYEVLNAVSAGLRLWSLPGVMLAGLGAAPH